MKDDKNINEILNFLLKILIFSIEKRFFFSLESDNEISKIVGGKKLYKTK